MGNGYTGQGTAISLVQTGFPMTVISISEPEYEAGEDVERPSLNLDPGAVVPAEPGDLVTAGTITVEFEWDETFDWETIERVKQDCIITHAPRAGQPNGQADVYPDAFVRSHTGPSHETSQRKVGSCVIRVQSRPQN